jgi:hypothetical protein
MLTYFAKMFVDHNNFILLINKLENQIFYKISYFIKMLFLLHVSAIYDHLQAFINNKIHQRSLLDCLSIAISLVM